MITIAHAVVDSHLRVASIRLFVELAPGVVAPPMDPSVSSEVWLSVTIFTMSTVVTSLLESSTLPLAYLVAPDCKLHGLHSRLNILKLSDTLLLGGHSLCDVSDNLVHQFISHQFSSVQSVFRDFVWGSL